MTVPSYRLAVDFGTSTTVAMLRWPDGRVRPLLFDGSPLLSSAVLLGHDGRLHTGRDAAHLGRAHPERLEPNPKRRVDERTVLLGDTDVAVPELITTVLRRVGVEARRVGDWSGGVILTHPAGWGASRRATLVRAAEQAGLGHPHLVAEPVAAATYFAQQQGTTVAPGACVLVYDLGAGTCDVTLLRRGPQGFTPIASDGLNDVGGLDIDATIVAFLQATYGELWHDAAGRRQVWDEVRSAKEMLSRANSTFVSVPALGSSGKEVPLGREQLEGLARPVLRSTVAMTQSLLREADVPVPAIAGLFLVGGSSRMPLVATLLHEAVGIAPVVTEQPELVVAEGALHVPVPAAGMASVGATPPRPAPPRPVPATAPRPGGPRPAVVLGVVAAIVVLTLLAGVSAVAYAWLNRTRHPDPSAAGKRASASPAAGALRNGSPAGPAPSTASPAVKYDMKQLPENLCAKADVSALAATFETADGTPSARRDLSTYLGSSSCILSRQHKGRDGLASSIATLGLDAYVFTDTEAAAKSHQDGRDKGKLNAQTVTDVPDIGENAFLYRPNGNAAAPQTDASYVLEARDGNLRWIVRLTATRIDDAAWSQADRARIEAAVIATARTTLGKLRS